MKRSYFTTKWVFVLAAVGSAAGLGNLWRFPYLAYEDGGGAFFVAYLTCLFLMGMTLLILETGLGQISRLAAPGALGQVTKSRHFGIIGWIAVAITFLVMQYYVVITSWAVNYAVLSYHLPWATQPETYFYKQFLHLSSNIGSKHHIVWPILIGTICIYSILFFIMTKGTKGISAVATFITPIPLFFLAVLALNSVFLPGANLGLHYYFVPEWKELLIPDVWFDAASQVFFSLSVGFGVMFAYGALLKEQFSVRYTAIAIVMGDTLVAFVGGIAIFSVIGHMSYLQGTEVHKTIEGGIGLTFIILPKALSLMPYMPRLLSIVFYVTLVGLAFTSIVSMTEAIVAALMDSPRKIKRQYYLLAVCILAFLGSILYIQSNGLYILDIIDHFISGYILVTVGLTECLLIGWLYNSRRLAHEINKMSGARVSFVFIWWALSSLKCDNPTQFSSACFSKIFSR
ncbi:MAG: neurotransmitter symporter family protein [Gammaproteobacteria bacterium]|nr:neurotransmitter symporter family protein [Gammaproteobacteria bacterium]